MIKKIPGTVLLLSCVFVSCGTTTLEATGLTEYEGTAFVMQVPAAWEAVDTALLSQPIRWNLELAMRSRVNKHGFLNNLTILSETLAVNASSGEYARQSMLWAAREYLFMTIESEEAIRFEDGSTSTLGIFRAQYNETTDERLFFQTAKVCWDTVHLLTLGLSSDTEPASYDQYRKILASFECR